MKYRPRWSLLTLGAIIVLLLFTFPVWRKILPSGGNKGGFAAASDAQREILSQINKLGLSVAPTAYTAMLTVVPAPTALQPTPILPDAQIIARGKFDPPLDAVRRAGGRVTLYRSADGSLLLRFDDFDVTNAPQMAVYLVATSTPPIDLKTQIKKEDFDIGGVSHFEVGPLLGSHGNQQFDLPRELPITSYQSVVIYSESLRIVYAFAELSFV
jgi:hypothetical protein